MVGPPQVPGEQRQGVEAPNATYSERLEGISWGSDIGEESCSPSHTHHVFVRICTLEGNFGAGEQSQCLAEDDG